MIIVVSDMYLGYKRSNKDDFINFLDKCDAQEIEHLVILDDIFDPSVSAGQTFSLKTTMCSEN